ncbi:NAD(P)-binding protein [Lindgomyces ingoldianus]|uniref:NAD(P)-binding protein n=1 Tax=Lindgomyces ingoldianus TaxID=673940 RepID=A0ACB6RF43_9PLEO|nr:NAD(P)-binding protein [Lindgomyces ingoldianus]KAF2477340.1 NAD(P)-binding protein [Lindgomyces ingoldianus]
MLKDDLSRVTYLGKPSGACCLEGNIHSGSPRGSFVTISGVETYISKPPERKSNGYPVWKHRKDRHDRTTEPDFDYEAWKKKHTSFAKEVVPKWVAAVKQEYGKPATKYACVGYCFGAPYVCDELAGDLCSAGVFAHPAFLKEHHFRDLKKPLLLSCAEVDHTFDTESRNKAVDIMVEEKKSYQLQLFSGVAHGFALRGDMGDSYERYAMTLLKAFDFTGEVAIVTGAGSRMPGEIGNRRATAILLARQEGGISEVIRTDVTDQESCRRAMARAVKLFGTIHILVNIIGVGGAIGDATKVDIDAWDRDLRINLTSTVLVARHCISVFRQNGRGSIVNMGRGMMGEMRKVRVSQNLMGVEGSAWDILLLCSKEAKWTTGGILPVDTGTTAGKAGRPVLNEDVLAEKNTGTRNSKL